VERSANQFGSHIHGNSPHVELKPRTVALHRTHHPIQHCCSTLLWCPGRESYATTDTTNRCLSLVWWRECLARWRRFATSRNHRGSPVLLLAGSLVRGEESLWPAGSRRLVEPLAGFKSWIGFEPITFRLLADERLLCARSGRSHPMRPRTPTK
jgi:hypothetical protein